MPDARSPRVWLAVAWSVFQLYTAYAGMYDLLIQLPVHVAFAVALGFLTAPIADSPEATARLARRRPRRWLDGALAALALLCAAHYLWHNERLASRMAMVDAPLPIDAAVGVLFVALLLGAAWRHIGPALVVMALAFIAYVFVGPRLPGFLSHGGESALNLIDQQMLTTQGVFGIPTLVSATFIFLFVVFGSVISYAVFFLYNTDAALAVAGHTQGGAGKVAVISSPRGRVCPCCRVTRFPPCPLCSAATSPCSVGRPCSCGFSCKAARRCSTASGPSSWPSRCCGSGARRASTPGCSSPSSPTA